MNRAVFSFGQLIDHVFRIWAREWWHVLTAALYKPFQRLIRAGSIRWLQHASLASWHLAGQCGYMGGAHIAVGRFGALDKVFCAHPEPLGLPYTVQWRFA